MAYLRVETSVARNHKFVKAGPDASWLWLCGLAYCQEGLTDGFIPREALDYLGVRHPKRLAVHLVEAGLWEVVDGGWQVHDYLDYNKPADRVRQIQRERRDAGASGGRAQANSRAVLKQELEASLNPATATSTATTTATATGHGKHAACGRVCVPQSLHEEFVKRRNTKQADTELRVFYREVNAHWSEGVLADVEPGGAFDFWRARYNERWPTTKTGPVGALTPTYTEWQCPHVEPCENRTYCHHRLLMGPEKYPVKVAS